jgi:hexulose-6-phosphate isomerase
MRYSIDRRQALALALSSAATAFVAGREERKLPRLKKAVKFGMIQTKGNIQEKFELIKSLGFEGVEIDSPSALDKKEALAAQEATGIKIHGVIDSVHWREPLSHPDEKVRASGLAALRTAIADAAFLRADTVLLVPAVVNKDATYEQAWERSRAEIQKAIPDAEKAGVKIAIETVWNNFITKPEQMIEYVDSFKTPVVGAYFDCSNMIKYGVPSAEWIRQLGKRMLKLDFKGFSKAKMKPNNDGAGFATPIGEGDEDWPEILKACAEVGYHGWATAEVAGGGEKVLRDISERMDRILQRK